MHVQPLNQHSFSRARAERVSQLKALQERNKKGLLSNAEKSRLAELQTEAKQNGDCVLM